MICARAFLRLAILILLLSVCYAFLPRGYAGPATSVVAIVCGYILLRHGLAHTSGRVVEARLLERTRTYETHRYVFLVDGARITVRNSVWFVPGLRPGDTIPLLLHPWHKHPVPVGPRFLINLVCDDIRRDRLHTCYDTFVRQRRHADQGPS
jgi:hypothetical protein